MKLRLFAIGLITSLVTLGSVSHSAINQHSYVGGNFALTLDGQSAGYLRSFSGGAQVAESIADPNDKRLGIFPKKRLGPTRIEPIEIDVGFQSKPINDWITAALAGRQTTKNGFVSLSDANYMEKMRLSFDRARLVQIELPALDAADSKTLALMHLILQPDATRRQAGSGARVGTAADEAARQAKTTPVSTFKLTIPNVETKGVSRIEEIIIKLSPTPTISNLIVTFAEGAKGWDDWYDEAVVKGAGGRPDNDTKERNGTIELMNARLQTIVRLNLRGLGINRLSLEKSESASNQVRRYTAEMHIEDLRVDFL